MSVGLFKRLVILLAVLVAVAYFLNRDEGRVKTPGALRSGDKVFPGLDVNRISEFKIVSNQREIRLRRGLSGWVVADWFDYPARFSSIAGFLRKFEELEVGQVMRAGTANPGEFGLDAGGDDGDWHLVEMRLTGVADPLVFTVGSVKQPRSEAGRGMAMPHGRFMRVADGPVLLVNELFFELSAQPADWVDATLLAVPADRVESVTVALADRPAYTMRRDGGGGYRLDDQDASEAIDQPAATALFQAVQLLRFDDVIDPGLSDDDAGLYPADRTEVVTADGLVYTIRAGRPSGSSGATRTVAISVASRSGAEQDVEGLAREQARLERWRFTVPNLALAALFTPREHVAPMAFTPPPLPVPVDAD